MSQLKEELLHNFAQFDGSWPAELQAVFKKFEKAGGAFETSYCRIAAIQGWRQVLSSQQFHAGVQEFFMEAQNDLLTSHCLARVGCFRSALKALRAAVENVYFFVYYKDHPVELSRWHVGQHKMGFSELTSYLEAHPLFSANELAKRALVDLKNEYATLSLAVHGSSPSFQMTTDLASLRLWSDDVSLIGKWSSRERGVITGMLAILTTLFAPLVQGTSSRGLRETMSLVLPKSKRDAYKKELAVNIPKS
jgi:hypothetical protein